MRIDRVLSGRFSEIGRKAASELTARGLVRVGGKRVKKSRVVSEGESVEVHAADALGHALPAPEVDLRVLLETPEFIVCDKPAGVPSVALPFARSGTMAGALLHRFPELKGIGYGPREPGLVHRLDTYTSGVLLAARTEAAFSALSAALSAHAVEKKYLAVVRSGINDSGSIETGIISDPSDPRRVIVLTESAAQPVYRSNYQTIRSSGGRSLVEVTVNAAYRHQVRAHLAHLGFPLIGDELYGGEGAGISPRHALHASYISAAATATAPFAVTSPLPDDLAALFS